MPVTALSAWIIVLRSATSSACAASSSEQSAPFQPFAHAHVALHDHTSSVHSCALTRRPLTPKCSHAPWSVQLLGHGLGGAAHAPSRHQPYTQSAADAHAAPVAPHAPAAQHATLDGAGAPS